MTRMESKGQYYMSAVKVKYKIVFYQKRRSRSRMKVMIIGQDYYQKRMSQVRITKVKF